MHALTVLGRIALGLTGIQLALSSSVLASPALENEGNEMIAVVTLGHGDFDQLVYTNDVPIPELSDHEVLVKVLACGMNNTDINTRVGWYADGGWKGSPTQFPLIQGTDCYGIVVKTGAQVLNSMELLNQKVLIRPCQRVGNRDSQWMGSDFAGAFAQFVKVKSTEVFVVNQTHLTDAELGAIPCVYGTAENMLHRAKVTEADTVLIVGASGGVGLAAVQLAKLRGATVIAITSKSKIPAMLELGCSKAFAREDDILSALGENTIDVVVDNVGGESFSSLFKLLKAGGRHVTSGAIGGPHVSLDMRDLYLKDITCFGCTSWDEPVFPNLIRYIENGQIRPVIAKEYPLERIADAQREFLEKNHIGKIVLIPPSI